MTGDPLDGARGAPVATITNVSVRYGRRTALEDVTAVLPALTLLALQVIFAGSSALITDNPWLVPGITLFCMIEVIAISFVMLALSSLSKSRRFVAAMSAGAVLFAAATYRVLRGLTGSAAWAWISPEDVFDALSIAIFRAPERPTLSLPAAMIAIGAIVAVSIVVLDRRIRAVDVVT